MEELAIRRIDIDKKEKIIVLKKLLVENKYPNPTTHPNDKKYFLPKLLIAINWIKDNLDNTLLKIVEVHRSRLVVNS